MAGSYNHCVDGEGRLLRNEDLVQMLENGGDVYEAVEEMYGMIWWLADQMSKAVPPGSHVPSERYVAQAHEHYRQGLNVSPGTGARLPDEDED